MSGNDIFTYIFIALLIFSIGITIKLGLIYEARKKDWANVIKRWRTKDFQGDFLQQFHDPRLFVLVRHRSYYALGDRQYSI